MNVSPNAFNSMPVLSIITPLYNKARFLADTAGSVLAQSFPDWEWIVVDNGSNDEGPSFVQGLSRKGIQLLKCDKRGPGAARNFGVSRATGEWVLFLDADDVLTPTYLTDQLRCAFEHPDADIVAGRWQEFPHRAPSARTLLMPPGWPEVGRQLLDSSIAFAPWAVHAALVRRRCIRDNLLWEESLDRLVAEDIVFWFRLVHTCKVAYSNTVGPLTRMGVPGSRTPSPADCCWLESMLRISQMNQAWLSKRGQEVNSDQHRSLAIIFAKAALAGTADPEISKRARQLATAHIESWWKLQPRPRGVGDLARRFLGPLRTLQYRSAQKQWVRRALEMRGWVGTVLTKSRHLGAGVPRLIAGTKMQIDESLRRWNFDCEAEVFEELRRYLRPGSVFVDIGANFGMHTLVAASLVGPAGRVLSFEPLPRNAALLRRHVRLNRLCKIVQVFEEAVSDSPEPFTFFSTDDSDPLGLTASIATGEAAGTLRVANIRLDDVLPHLASQVDVIKIDVEGAEHAVLRGAAEMLRRQRPVLIIEVHGYALPDFSSSVRLLDQYLQSLGYSGRKLKMDSSLMDSYFHSVYTTSPQVL